jgi:hypothetical protein
MQLNHTRGASMGRVADARPILLHDIYRNHCGGQRVKMQDLPLARHAGRRVGTRPEAAQVPRRQHAGSRPPAGSRLEPARPGTAGETLRDVTSGTRATKLDQKSWDFDESEQVFGEKRNPPKPHASP